MKLYEISQTYFDVINGGMVFDEETGEVIFDSSNLDELNEKLESKLEACGIVIKNLEADSFAYDQEIKRLQEKKRVAVNKVSSIKSYIMRCLEGCDISKLDTPKVSMRLRSSEYLDIEDASLIPDEYKTIDQVEKVSKNDVKQAIKNGATIQGAIVKTRTSVQVK